jgi:hypothetical protein
MAAKKPAAPPPTTITFRERIGEASQNPIGLAKLSRRIERVLFLLWRHRANFAGLVKP